MIDLSRVLITGGQGLIGRQLPFGIKASRKDLDVTSIGAVRDCCRQLNPTGIIALSSYDMRTAEAQPFDSYKTNVAGVCHLAKEAAMREIPIIIISSGAVFNGPLGTRFDENSQPEPLQHYGLSKYLAEEMVQSIAMEHLIIRTGWVFGGIGAHHINFIDMSIDKALKGENITASNNQEGSPTYLDDLVLAMEKAIRAGERGILHIVNDGIATALDIAQAIVSNTKSATEIESMSQTTLSAINRSPSEALISTKLSLRPWQEALAEYIARRTNDVAVK